MGGAKNTLRNLVLTGEELSTRPDTSGRPNPRPALWALRKIIGDSIDHTDTPPVDCWILVWP